MKPGWVCCRRSARANIMRCLVRSSRQGLLSRLYTDAWAESATSAA